MTKSPTLDTLDLYQKLDEDKLFGGYESLADQITHAWELVSASEAPKNLEYDHIIFAGMGGSALGADIARTALADRLQVPIIISQDYQLPQYVGNRSLVIGMSFSGNTEETVSAVTAAHDAGAQVIVMTGGGKLAELAAEHNWPQLELNTDKNQSKQSRVALGYAIIMTLGLLDKIGALEFTETDLNQIQTTVLSMETKNQISTPTEENPAKTMAFSLFSRRPILLGADFLEGALHTVANQYNENAKVFAEYHLLPEVNHHLMEGLQFPDSNKYDHLFLFVESDLYHEANQKRVELTREVLHEQNLETLKLRLNAETKLAQVFELISTLGYAALYLAMIEQINPGPIPVVNEFKSRL